MAKSIQEVTLVLSEESKALIAKAEALSASFSIPRCATCKHWGGHEERFMGLISDCKKITVNASHYATLLCETDADKLMTGPDFGCTLHETKEPG